MHLIDKDIAEKIATGNGLSLAKLGLRFDKVVVRLLSDLRRSVSADIPGGVVVLLTISAPIKLPAKTELALCTQIREVVKSGTKNNHHASVVFQNNISIRVIHVPIQHTEKVVGFVHNPGCDSKRLLDLAEDWLLKNSMT